MSLLPHSIPRATNVEQFHEDPLGFLATARASLGDIFVIRDAEPIFSRDPECSGTVAVFGSAHHRIVLSDIDLFTMPASAAEHLSLPPSLVNLNRGLHSMRGEQHTEHQRLLMRVLGERSMESQHPAVSAGLETFARAWQSGSSIGLLGEMRRLTLEMSTRLLFGTQYTESSSLALLLQTYFHLRREAASPFNSASETLREDLKTLGTVLDQELRRYVRWCHRHALGSSAGVLCSLANLESPDGARLSEDEMVAHSNVLFMSSTEPVAVSLAWICLILSQLPDLRSALRRELNRTARDEAVPAWSELADLPLLDSVVNETLRLFPANALMVRVTTSSALLQNVRLPGRCELVLCPFLAHREAERFPRPLDFLPSRWKAIKPSAFEYFPFGAGGHVCVGRHLAIHMIKAAMALLIPRYELVLAGDQEIDWRIHIQFMPRNDPIMCVGAPGVSESQPGKLLGPVAGLVRFDARGL